MGPDLPVPTVAGMPSSRATNVLAARAARVSPGTVPGAGERDAPVTEPLDSRRAVRAASAVAPPAATDPLAARLVRGSDGVLQLPGTLRGARVSPPVLAVVGAALVVLVAVVSVLVAVFRTDAAAQPVPTRNEGAPTALATGSTIPTGSGLASTVVTSPAVNPSAPVPTGTTPAPALMVHVVGQVKRPGVVTVPAGSRVKDALDRAGGATRKAVLSGLNLARPVVDGEQIVVPDTAGAPVPVNTLAPPTGPQGAGTTAAPGGAGAGAQVDLNAADQAALEALPEVGPVLAAKILEWRAAHGRFTTVDELGEVSGVGEKTLETLRPHVRV